MRCTDNTVFYVVFTSNYANRTVISYVPLSSQWAVKQQNSLCEMVLVAVHSVPSRTKLFNFL